MSDCVDLIGTPYVYGNTDCIWLALTALERMGIEAPPMNRDWYKMPSRRWARDLIKWGKRIERPSYNGDVLLQAAPVGFSVVWDGGLLYICKARSAVHWSPLKLIDNRCFHTNDSSSRLSVFRSRNIEN